MRSSLQAYQKVNRESNLVAADPHTVILMLFDGILESISVASGAIERKDLSTKSVKITKAVNILRSLQDSLDNESEPEISDNLFQLYDYCVDSLMDASVSLNLNKLNEVVELLKPLRDAWRNMPESGKQQGIVMINTRDQAQAAI